MLVPDTKLITLDESGLDFLKYREGSGKSVEVYDIAVNTARCEGRGRRMMDELCRRYEGTGMLVWAMTRESNRGAQTFYTRCGFHLLGVLHKFYHVDREHAYVFGRELPKILPERKIDPCG